MTDLVIVVVGSSSPSGLKTESSFFEIAFQFCGPFYLRLRTRGDVLVIRGYPSDPLRSNELRVILGSLEQSAPDFFSPGEIAFLLFVNTTPHGPHGLFKHRHQTIVNHS